MRGTSRRGARDEEGFTLVELLLALMLGVIVLGVAGTLMLTGIRAQASVTAAQDVTQTMTLVDSSLTTAVRNAAAAPALTATGLPPGDQFAEVASARVSGGGATSGWRCVAWYYRAANATLYTSSRSGAIAVPSTAALAHWQLLGTGIAPAASGQPVFAVSGGGLAVSLRITAGSASPQSYATTIAPQLSAAMTTGAPSCSG